MFAPTPTSLTGTHTNPYARLDTDALRHIHSHLNAPTQPDSTTTIWDAITNDTMHLTCGCPQKITTTVCPIGYRTIAINAPTTQPDTGAITHIHRLTRHNILDTLSWDMSTFTITHQPQVRSHHDTIYVLNIPELGPRKLYWRDQGAYTNDNNHSYSALRLGFWDNATARADNDAIVLDTEKLLASQDPALLATPSLTDDDKDNLVANHPVISHYLNSATTTSAQALFAHPALVAFLASHSARELTAALFGAHHVRKDTVRLVGQSSVDILLHLWDLYGHHDIMATPYIIPTDYIASRARILNRIHHGESDNSLHYSTIATSVNSTIMDMLHHHRHNVWRKIIHTPTDSALVVKDFSSAQHLATFSNTSCEDTHPTITKLCTTTARDLSKTKTYAAFVKEAHYVSIDNPEPDNQDCENMMSNTDTLEWITQDGGPGQQWYNHDCPHSTPELRKRITAQLTSDADRQRNTSAMISQLWTISDTWGDEYFTPADSTNVSAQGAELVAFIQATEQNELRTWGHDSMMRHCIGGYPITDGIYLAHLTIDRTECDELLAYGDLSDWSPTGYTAHTEQGNRGACTVNLVHTSSATATVHATMNYTTHIPGNNSQYSYTSYGYRNNPDTYHDARMALIDDYILTTTPRR